VVVEGFERIFTFLGPAGQGRVVFGQNSQEECCHHEEFQKLKEKETY